MALMTPISGELKKRKEGTKRDGREEAHEGAEEVTGDGEREAGGRDLKFEIGDW
jgi:hypothetical protein